MENLLFFLFGIFFLTFRLDNLTLVNFYSHLFNSFINNFPQICIIINTLFNVSNLSARCRTQFPGCQNQPPLKTMTDRKTPIAPLAIPQNFALDALHSPALRRQLVISTTSRGLVFNNTVRFNIMIETRKN
jgi:hypothetical protein